MWAAGPEVGASRYSYRSAAIRFAQRKGRMGRTATTVHKPKSGRLADTSPAHCESGIPYYLSGCGLGHALKGDQRAQVFAGALVHECAGDDLQSLE